MTKRSLTNAERGLKYDKKVAEKAMEVHIAREAEEIVDAMVAQAKQGSFQHGAYMLDRLFGKVKQRVDVESGGEPIVFMPAILINKFGLDKPVDKQLPEYVEEES